MTDNTASAGSNGAGQQLPNDSVNETNNLAFAVKRILAKYDTMLPVKVIAVHSGSGTPPGPSTVDVQPLLSRVDGNMNGIEEGTVYGLPVSRIQGGPWTIICDPAAGDVGWVVAADRDISKVKASNGSPGLPGSSRRFSIADGIYAGSILTNPGKAFLWLKSDGTLEISDAGGFVIQTDGSGNATMKGNVTVQGNVIATGNIQTGGNLLIAGQVLAQDGSEYGGTIQTSGDVIAGSISLKGHGHPYTAPSSGGIGGTRTGNSEP